MSAISAACPICHDPLITSVTLSCDHKVHRACMRKFAKTNEGCPECNLSGRVVTRSTAPEAVAKAAEEVLLTSRKETAPDEMLLASRKETALEIWKRESNFLEDLHQRLRADDTFYTCFKLPTIEAAPESAEECLKYIREDEAYREVVNEFSGIESSPFPFSAHFTQSNPIFKKMILILAGKVEGDGWELVHRYTKILGEIKCFSVEQMETLVYVAARFGKSRELKWLYRSTVRNAKVQFQLYEIVVNTCRYYKTEQLSYIL